MKKVLGLEINYNNIGWAIVNIKENDNEQSNIEKVGTRAISLSVDETANFERGKSITSSHIRSIKRGVRRNNHRNQYRRDVLIQKLQEYKILTEDIDSLYEKYNTAISVFELRSKVLTEKISLNELARVLLSINKSRGYKSSRKARNQDEGLFIDGIAISKELHQKNITPGQFIYKRLLEQKTFIPVFYRSDLTMELDKIWQYQKTFFKDILTEENKHFFVGKNKANIIKFFSESFKIEISNPSKEDKILFLFGLRNDALERELKPEELAVVIGELYGLINGSSNYLATISDNSKELYFKELTIGQYFLNKLRSNPIASLKNIVFYRQDHINEFNAIWDKQAEYHPILTENIKNELRDNVIFYQRKLKSSTFSIPICEFERQEIEVTNGDKIVLKTIGPKVCHKSSPLYQELKIRTALNNVKVINNSNNERYELTAEQKEILFEELTYKNSISKKEILKMFFPNYRDLDLSYKEINGNRTNATLFKNFAKIIEINGLGKYDFTKMKSSEIIETTTNAFEQLNINTDILTFDSSVEGTKLDKQPSYQLWHLLFSYEGDNSSTGHKKLIEKLIEKYGFNQESAVILANIYFIDNHANLSIKAIRKILPLLKDGLPKSLPKTNNSKQSAYDILGYSKQKSNKKDDYNQTTKIDNVERNTLCNSSIEKITNQLINVVNKLNNKYGTFDAINVKIDKLMKKSCAEREVYNKHINNSKISNEKYCSILKNEFGLNNPSSRDIIRYKLYEELAHRGYKTWYSNTVVTKERLFTNDFNIDHIIPISKLHDNSFSNKILETSICNIDKGNKTAFDYVQQKNNEDDLNNYLHNISKAYEQHHITKKKYKNLRIKENEIPRNIINKSILDQQFYSKQIKNKLENITEKVLLTNNIVNNKLRDDWDLNNIILDLNWARYDKIEQTKITQNRHGQNVYRINDWNQKQDHRYSAMEAILAAFTTEDNIKKLNSLNDEDCQLYFESPIEHNEFVALINDQLASTIVSFKKRKRVLTNNNNIIRKNNNIICLKQRTPRTQLHLETIYGKRQRYLRKYEKINGFFDAERIKTVVNKDYQKALLQRLEEYNFNPKKAFTGVSRFEKKPLYIDQEKNITVPQEVMTSVPETIFTIRKEITPDIKIHKVIDLKIRKILEERLAQYNGDPNKAFVNLEENPIWLNKERGIDIKRVKINGITSGIPIHHQINENGEHHEFDYINTANNHHIAIYIDEHGDLQDYVISYFDVVKRLLSGKPAIDKEYRAEDGWTFALSLHQNEYFVFPDEETGFHPRDIDLMLSSNYHLITPHLYRLQTFSKLIYGENSIRDYVFRHHTEFASRNNSKLKDVSYKQFKGLKFLKDIVKVNIDNIGRIISIGEDEFYEDSL